MKTIAKLLSVTQVNHYVYQIKLIIPEGGTASCIAGQYANLFFNNKAHPYSLANNCHKKNIIELHIGVRKDGNCTSSKIIQQLIDTNKIPIELPLGNCLYKSSDKNLLFATCGTGYSQMQSLIERHLESNSTNHAYLFWSVKSRNDFYLLHRLRKFEFENDNFHAHLLYPANRESSAVPQTQVLDLYHSIANYLCDLTHVHCYLGGSPIVVNSLVEKLRSINLVPEQTYSDALPPYKHRTSMQA